MNYYALIDEYLNAEQSDINPKTREDYRRAITLGVDFLTQHEYSAPSNEFFADLKADLLNGKNESTVNRKLMPPINKFFLWAETKQKEDTQTEPIEPDAEDKAQHTQKKRGRKMLGDEPRTAKISIYLTPSLLADAQDLARLDGIRFADYVYCLIQQDTQNRASKIEALRALRE